MAQAHGLSRDSAVFEFTLLAKCTPAFRGEVPAFVAAPCLLASGPAPYICEARVGTKNKLGLGGGG